MSDVKSWTGDVWRVEVDVPRAFHGTRPIAVACIDEVFGGPERLTLDDAIALRDALTAAITEAQKPIAGAGI